MIGKNAKHVTEIPYLTESKGKKDWGRIGKQMD